MYVFVVGVWKVQLKQGDVPSLEPHKPAGDWRPDPLGGVFKAIADWFANPFNQLFIWLLLIVIALIILAFFAPGLLRGMGKVAEAAGERVDRKIRGNSRRRRR